MVLIRVRRMAMLELDQKKSISLAWGEVAILPIFTFPRH